MLRELNELEYVSFAVGQPFNIAVMLKFQGKIEIDLLNKTLLKLQKKHPLLKSRIFFSENERPMLTSEGVGIIPILLSASIPMMTSMVIFFKLMTPYE